jgi:hypothetical protein
VCDGGSELTFGGTRRIHVDPLMIFGCVRELVDPALIDFKPWGGAEVRATQIKKCFRFD